MRFLVLAFALAACTSHGAIDEVIGAGCTKDTDCANRCYTGPGFPGGFCSESCTSDADCPGDAVCATENGGVCLFACPPFDCGRLGGGWHCADKDRAGGGKASVCTGG
jgi:serine protease